MSRNFFELSRHEKNNKVVILTFNTKGKEVNVFSEPCVLELKSILEELKNEKNISGMIITSGKGDSFIAGADIDEISKCKTAEEAEIKAKGLQNVFSMVHDLPFPSVAAIHGVCLGGGLELSLACDWRVATDDSSTKLGLPEIQLGLIPGAGGTQRLPRLIGIQLALDFILTGKKVDGKKALKIGLIDACTPESLLMDKALSFTEKKRSHGSGQKNSFSQMALEGNFLGRQLVESKARAMVKEKTKGFYPASFKALDAVFDGFSMDLKQGLDYEAQIFGQLAITRECASLIHLYYTTTQLKKNPYKTEGEKVFGSGKNKIEQIGVVGAGFMGAGIATVAADKEIRVVMSDPNKEAIGRSLKSIQGYFSKQKERKKIKSFDMERKVSKIHADIKPLGLKKCDVVIEAVFEDLNLKQKILKDLESGTDKNWVFASNTSALPISQIAEISKSPEKILGMHFFSPVEKMPLLEIIVTDKTAPWAAYQAFELGKKLGKQNIVVKDSPGFYTTRALGFYLCEAANLLLEGAPMEKIDKSLTAAGFPVGPITLIDEVGIDVGVHVLETLEKAFPDRITTPPEMKKIIDSGKLGRKNNNGFYAYANGKKGGPDQRVYEILGVDSRGKHTNDQILDRCLLVFINESVRSLEEGILFDPASGDVGAVFGLGFPPFWGGPFKYIDYVGAQNIVEKLSQLYDLYGPQFEPAKLLKEKAERGSLFFPSEA